MLFPRAGVHRPVVIGRCQFAGNNHLTPTGTNSNLDLKKFMAENIPNTPSGAVPPRPTEAAKVQPKKETVRINLPPKPTAAPTIKIPAPAPSAAAAAAAPAVAPAPAAARTPAPAPPTPAPRATAAPTGRPAPAPRTAPIMAGISGVDKALAVVAALVVVVVLVRVLML